MWGANRLAFEALPLIPIMPKQSGAATVGFRGRGSRDTTWTWPVWEDPVDLETASSLLNLDELQKDEPPRQRLDARGVTEIYRSRRITVDKFRAFTPAWSP